MGDGSEALRAAKMCRRVLVAELSEACLSSESGTKVCALGFEDES